MVPRFTDMPKYLYLPISNGYKVAKQGLDCGRCSLGCPSGRSEQAEVEGTQKKQQEGQRKAKAKGLPRSRTFVTTATAAVLGIVLFSFLSQCGLAHQCDLA